MKIIIGCDHAGLELKGKLVSFLKSLDHRVEDVGTHDTQSTDYPLYAAKVARAVAAGRFDRGVLVCGTAIGMCITANRVVGIRAVGAYEPYAAKMSRRHNDSNVLCLGARLTGVDLALEILDVWLKEPFEGGRHQRRVDLIDRLANDPDSDVSL